MSDMELPCLVFALLGFPCYNSFLPFGMGLFTLLLYIASVSHVFMVVLVLVVLGLAVLGLVVLMLLLMVVVLFAFVF